MLYKIHTRTHACARENDDSVLHSGCEKKRSPSVDVSLGTRPRVVLCCTKRFATASENERERERDASVERKSEMTLSLVVFRQERLLLSLSLSLLRYRQPGSSWHWVRWWLSHGTVPHRIMKNERGKERMIKDKIFPALLKTMLNSYD